MQWNVFGGSLHSPDDVSIESHVGKRCLDGTETAVGCKELLCGSSDLSQLDPEAGSVGSECDCIRYESLRGPVLQERQSDYPVCMVWTLGMLPGQLQCCVSSSNLQSPCED